MGRFNAPNRPLPIAAPPDAAAPGVGSFYARMTTSELATVFNCPIKILSLTIVQFYGGGQCAKAAWIYPKVAAGDGLLRPTDQQV